MPILFSLISRNTTILVKHSCSIGNFREVAEKFLNSMPIEDQRITYSHGNFLFNCICNDRLVYLCITDNQFPRSRSFKYLTEIRKKFIQMYGVTVDTALAYAMNNEFNPIMESEITRCNTDSNYDPLSKVQNQVSDVKAVMVKNIEDLVQRGQKIEKIVQDAENLTSHSTQFYHSGRELRRTMYWRYMKTSLIIGLIALIVIYFIVCMICGGLTWGKCIH